MWCMKPETTTTHQYNKLVKSLTDLMEVLEAIDLEDDSSSENEWSIDDNNGGRILLNYVPKSRKLTITKARLKLTLNIEPMPNGDRK